MMRFINKPVTFKNTTIMAIPLGLNPSSSRSAKGRRIYLIFVTLESIQEHALARENAQYFKWQGHTGVAQPFLVPA
jgi:hypothetical protein